jgi:hypothetical protein
MKQQGTLKKLQILHRAMLFGQIVFAAVAFFLLYTNKFTPSLAEKDQLLQVIAITISFGGFFIGSTIFKKKLQQARDSATDIKLKADAYRLASIIQWTLLEGPCLLCIIFFLLVGNYAFLALAAAIMFWFALNGPSKIKVMMLLRLSEEEMENF